MRNVIFTLAALLVSGTACAQAYVGIAGGATKQALSCESGAASSCVSGLRGHARLVDLQTSSTSGRAAQCQDEG